MTRYNEIKLSPDRWAYYK